jgi:Myb/SANT-like DNA-binding domain
MPPRDSAKPKLKWQPAMEEALLDTLLDAQTQGLQTDNGGFKITAWNLALDAIKAGTFQEINIQQIKSKYDSLKQDWKAWKAFTDHTGLGWDCEKGVPTGPPDVLEAFFTVYPRARKFRDSPIPNESKLRTLLDGAMATGQYGDTIGNMLQPSDSSDETNTPNETPPDNEDNDGGNSEPYSWTASPPAYPTPPTATPDVAAAANPTPPTVTPGVAVAANPSPPTATPSAAVAANPSPPTATPSAAVAANPSPPTATPGAAVPANPTPATLRNKKRKAKNAAEADLRKRKKSSGHAIADVLAETVNEWKNTNLLFSDQLKQRDDIARRRVENKEKDDLTSRIVGILISDFGELSVIEQDLVNTVLENRSKALLFLSQTPERRRDWVEQIIQNEG